MKLLRVSPVEFLAPLSKPPERLSVSEVQGSFGTLYIAGTQQGIVSISFAFSIDHFAQKLRDEWGSDIIRDRGLFPETLDSLRSYLNGDRDPIRATIQPVMENKFTIKVHTILTRIPYGKAYTYLDIAKALGSPSHARAVGGACQKNQTLIVVPCHRVIAVHGLGGFSSGLKLKQRLLEHEGIVIGGKRR